MERKSLLKVQTAPGKIRLLDYNYIFIVYSFSMFGVVVSHINSDLGMCNDNIIKKNCEAKLCLNV